MPFAEAYVLFWVIWLLAVIVFCVILWWSVADIMERAFIYIVVGIVITVVVLACVVTYAAYVQGLL